MTTAIEKATTDIEQVLTRCNVSALQCLSGLTQAVTLAGGIQQLRAALSDDIVKQVFMPLQGSVLGFLTDKDASGGYPVSVVRDCMIEAMIHGLRPVGNEINIISGRMYAAKAGVMRLVLEHPGVTDVRVTPGCPTLGGDGKEARVPFRIEWKLNTVPQSIVREATKRPDGSTDDSRIVVRVNERMGPDAILGKATRKAFKAVLDQLRGNVLPVHDGEAIDTVGEAVAPPTPPDTGGRRVKLGKQASPEQEATPNPEEDGR